jgi:hypothetical protein
MLWSLGIPIGLTIALCGAILHYATNKFNKFSLGLMIGGIIFAFLTLIAVFLFFV